MKVNLVSLISERKLEFVPKHFTNTSIKVDDDTMIWVYENTIGRFAVFEKESDFDDMFSLMDDKRFTFAFEDPKEAVICELTWS